MRSKPRKYGALASAIRTLAATGKPFTRLAVKADYTKLSKMRMLLAMYRNGELVRVKRGTVGWQGSPAIYKGK